MDILVLDDDESYEKLCGEILLTTKGNIALCCTLCEVIYKNYDSYIDHLYEQHLSVKSFREILNQEATENCTVDNSINDENDDSVSFIKIDIEPSEKRFQDDERSMSPVDESSKIPKVEENENLSNYKITCSPKQNSCTKTNPYNDVRKANRSSVTPDEERKHKCPICNAFLKSKHILKGHIKRHSSDKKHDCPECGKKFHTNTEVRIHMQSHSSERSFLCSQCGRSYFRSSHLLAHIKRHTNQRNYKCDICDKAFYENKTLKMHIMGHSSERPFACNICSAKFTQKSALINHIKLHENKREYKCKLCEAGFNQKAGLASHMKMTHKLT